MIRRYTVKELITELDTFDKDMPIGIINNRMEDATSTFEVCKLDEVEDSSTGKVVSIVLLYFKDED